MVFQNVLVDMSLTYADEGGDYVVFMLPNSKRDRLNGEFMTDYLV